MRSIASLEADVVGSLLEHLKKEAIPVEVRTASQKSGLDIKEVMVEDSYYERACDVAERWEAERVAEAVRGSGRHCPKCGSQHLTYVPLENLVPCYRCKDCGHEFLGRRV